MGDGLARRGANQPRIGDFNQTVVLDAIRRAGGLSRVEVAAATGLAAQTVSNICRRLLDVGLLVEGGRTSGGRGKPRTILRLDPAGRYTVGVHLDPAVLSVVLLDLTGAVVAQTRVAPPAQPQPAGIVAAIASAVTELIARSAVERDRVLGVGIAAPGPVDLDGGALVDPPNLAGWRRVPLRDAVRAATGFPVLLEKDVTAAAVAEAWTGGPRGTGTFLVVYLGIGLGVGLVLRGEVVRGASGNAGEIGHIVTEPDGPTCRCGLRGCLCVTVTPRELLADAVATGALDTAVPAEPAAIDAAFTVLCERAAAGPGAARDVVDRSAVRLARAVAVLANLVDVDRVVFGGPFWARLAPFYLPRMPALLRDEMMARAIHGLEVAGSSVGDNLGAVGAASLVLDQTFSPHPAALVRAPGS
jgi:predicted NBD/HSP70 family sugar kinase